MATVAITNHLVCPTENDINGGTSGAGIIPTEDTLGKMLRNPTGMTGYVISGFTAPTTGTSNRTQTIAAGVAVIDGYVVSGSATNSITFTASANEYWWLQLVYTSGKVTGLQFFSTATATSYPANSIPLWRVDCNSTDVTAVIDKKIQNRVLFGKVTSAGAISDHGSGGWSVSGPSSSVYTLTFGSGYNRTPCVLVSVNDSTAGIASANPTSATSVAVSTFSVTGTASDRAFSFWAVL